MTEPLTTPRTTAFTPGQRVTWWHQPRAGYSIGYAVDAVVVAVHKTRVTIRVKRRVRGDAEWTVVDRRVTPAHLRAKVEEVRHG